MHCIDKPDTLASRTLWRKSSDTLANALHEYKRAQSLADSWPDGHRLRHAHERAALALFPRLIDAENAEKLAYRGYMLAIGEA